MMTEFFTKYRRTTAMLIAAGVAPSEASKIVFGASRGDTRLLRWIRNIRAGV